MTSWWRITGDPSAAVPVLPAALEPLRSGAADAPCREAAPLLEATLTSDRCFPADVHPAARAALAAFNGEAPPDATSSHPHAVAGAAARGGAPDVAS